MMKQFYPAVIVAPLLAVTGCLDSSVQHAERPLPVGSAEQRARDAGDDARRTDPRLTPGQAASDAAANTLGRDTKAEADWRRNQAADVEREKFRKDLDAAATTP